MQRDPALHRLRAGGEVFDLLVIGGGASGLGAALDAAARGHRVALIERGDFGEGTSSRSTKLVHGGVRYLRQGNIGLVRSALRERELLRQNAPHLVRPRAFVIPTHGWAEQSWYALGLALYDGLARSSSFGTSRRLNRAETLAHLPTLQTTGLTGGVRYFDGQFDDARLAIALAQSAVTLGAVLVNYCEAVGVWKESGRVAGALLRDRESGAEFCVAARVVVNAAGIFVDEVRRFDEPAAAPAVRLSQGVHLVLPRAFLPGDAALMVPKTADGRVLFVIPWHDRVLVGTTDTPIAAASENPRPLRVEIDFLFEHARRHLTRPVQMTDVCSVFAGIRALARGRNGETTAALARDHVIATSGSGLVTVTGGKWTTYRQMAEDIVDHAERVGGLVPRPCRTQSLPLHGAAMPVDGPGWFYGSDATEIARLAGAEPAAGEKLHPALALTKAEVLWHVRSEMARTVADVLARRTRSLVLDAAAAIAAAPSIAAIMRDELARDPAWAAAQVDEFRTLASAWLINPAIS